MDVFLILTKQYQLELFWVLSQILTFRAHNPDRADSSTDVIQPGILAKEAIIASSLLWALRPLILSRHIRSEVSDNHVSLWEGYYVLKVYLNQDLSSQLML